MVSRQQIATNRLRWTAVARHWATAVLLGAALILVVDAGTATATTVKAEIDRKRVPVGETVELTITVEGSFGGAPTVAKPQIEGVEVYRGGTSQSFVFSDGHTEATVTTVFHLQVRRQTDFKIPALKIELEGREYTTRTITVEVLSADQPSDGQKRSADTGRRTASEPASRGEKSSGGQAGDDVFITTSVDRAVVYVSEQIVLSFKYYRRITPWENPTYKAPRTEGFWREDLPPERHYRTRVRKVNYQVTEIRYALFPARAGELTIEPAELTFPDDPFGRFFSRRRHSGPRRLVTDPIVVQVRPLPKPRPPGFTGVVAATVGLTAEVDRSTVPRGEAVGLKIVLRADGFLKSLADLPVDMPETIRLHDAAEKLEVDVSGERLRSRLVVEKVLVPTREGTYSLPAVALSYFDPDEGRYRTARARPGVLTVVPSDLPVAGDEMSGFLRSEVARLGRDLAFVHPVSGGVRRRWQSLPELWYWWAVLLLPIVALGVWRQLLVRREATLRDPTGTRRRRAIGRARRTITQAGRSADRVAAHTQLAHAIAGYVADRLDRPSAGVTAAQVQRYAADIGCRDAGRRLAEIMQLCDQARFSSSTDSARPVDPLLAEVRRLLDQLAAVATKRRKRSGPVVGTILLLVWFASGIGSAQAQIEPAVLVGPGPGVDPTRLVAEGNSAYTDGDIAQARELYLRARQLGVNDTVVHYNLGNAYAREGQLGQAIASYLRARRLAPRDRDIATNLRWVRTHISDLSLEEASLPPVIAQVVAVVGYFTLDEWSVLLVVLVWAVTLLFGYGWYRGITERLRRLLLGTAALLTIVAALVGWRWYDECVRDTAVIIVAEVEVRSGPAATFPVVFKVHDGLTVNRRGSREGWARVTLGGDWVGWVPAHQVESVRLER